MIRAKRHTEPMPCEGGGRDKWGRSHRPRDVKDCVQPSKAGRRAWNRSSLRLRKEPTVLTSWFQVSSLRNCGGMSVCCLNPSFTEFVMLLQQPLDTTERLPFHFSLSCIGEGNGNPLQFLAWRLPGMVEPDGLQSLGLHRVGHDWSNLAAAAAAVGGNPIESLQSLALSTQWHQRKKELQSESALLAKPQR